MNKRKLYLAGILFILGLIGISSMLTMDIPLPEEARVILEEQFSPEQIKFVLLINPVILLIGFIVVGTIFYDKCGLQVPLIESLVTRRKSTIPVGDIVRYGVVGGISAGILLTLIGAAFFPQLPEEFIALGEKIKPTLAARFLYGGLTEEILMRFGLMTFLVWLFSKIFKGTSSTVYWIGIVIAAVLFALGHFPIAFQAVGTPSVVLLTYIIVGNTIGGIIFGWLYWQKGLESAFIAHIFAHVVMVLAEPLVGSM